MDKLKLDKESFFEFALIALDFNLKGYTPIDLEALKGKYTVADWEKFKHWVLTECKKIKKYSSNKDDKVKAEVIGHAAEFENNIKFFFNRSGKYNQIEGKGSSIPPQLINSRDIEAYERRLRAKDERFNHKHFNLHTFNLFEYLVEKYNPKKKPTKFCDIFYFLKDSYKPDNNSKLFALKQKEYNALLIEEYGVSIKRFYRSANFEEQKITYLESFVAQF